MNTHTVESTLPLTMSVVEAGKLLGISRLTAYKLAESGDIPTIRLGTKTLRVPTKKLLERLEDVR